MCTLEVVIIHVNNFSQPHKTHAEVMLVMMGKIKLAKNMKLH